MNVGASRTRTAEKQSEVSHSDLKAKSKEKELIQRRSRIKTPFIQQLEAVECGAAALAAMLAHYELWEPLSELRRQCGVSRDGSKAANILRAARRYGFEAKGVSKGVNSLRELQPPYIVFWEFNHFLVVEGFSQKQVYLNDPAVGHRRVSWAQFDDSFTGVVLLMQPGPEFVKSGCRPSTIPGLWKRTHGSRRALVFIMMCGFLGVVPGIVSAAYTRIIVDEVITGGAYDWLRPILVAMVVTLVFQIGGQILSGLFNRRMTMAMAARLQAQYVRHMLKLPSHFFAQRYVGEVVARTGINDALVGMIAGQLTGTAVGIISMIVFGIVLTTYNMPLTAIGVCSTIVNFLLLRMVADRRMEANLAISKESGKLQGITFAGIQSIEMIKANGLDNSFFEKWSGQFSNTNIARQQLQVDNQIFSVLPTVTGTFVNLFTMVIGGLYVLEGDMSFGELMAFNALMGLFLGPISQLLGFSVEIQQVRGNLARLEDVLDFETIDQRRDRQFAAVTAGHPQSAPADLGSRLGRLTGAVSVNGLSFGYQPLEPPIIKNVSLQIEPGQQVALVGGSGSGKSTVAKIVAGLLEPASGDVLFDGYLQQTIDQDLLAVSMTIVDQDIQLFGGTVRENLNLWDESIPEEWMREALQDANLLNDVLALPGGLDAMIAEGGQNLSGGQRQRMELARALTRRPSLLVMDEATSALDVITEAHVIESLRRRRCSALVVAHRLSTIRAVNRILVMDRGKVIEEGDHETLWKAEGHYYHLVRHEG